MKLRRGDVLLGKGTKVPELCKRLEITEQTYYRWRQKYGGMQPAMEKQLWGLEQENARLKKLVAKQALDRRIPRETSKSPSINGKRSMNYVVVWGHGRCRSVEHAGSALSSVVPCSTSLARWMMNHAYFVKCVLCPGDVHAAKPVVLAGCRSNVIGR